MKSRAGFSMVFAVAIAAAGCGTNDKTSGPSGSAPTAESSKIKPFKFSTGKFEIQPGDTFECFYTDTITDRQINVKNAYGTQSKGGHHITVYYAEQKQPVGHHPCQDVEMIGLRQIAAGGDGKEGIIGLPDGYATKIPPGKQLVVQSHYIRTEPGPQTVEDEIELETLESEDVKTFVNGFVMVDTGFSLAPRAKGKSSTDCVVPRDVDVLLLLGHMHEWGSSYKLERIENGKPVETIYETPWEPLFTSHPPVTRYEGQKPLHLAKGTRIRQTCQWDNTEEKEMTFPREMCVLFSYYFPDDGFLQCESKAASNGGEQ